MICPCIKCGKEVKNDLAYNELLKRVTICKECSNPKSTSSKQENKIVDDLLNIFGIKSKDDYYKDGDGEY